jgi:hypothetical protein
VDPLETVNLSSHLHRFDVAVASCSGDQRPPGDARTCFRIAQQVKPLSSGCVVFHGEAVGFLTTAPLDQRIVCHRAILSGHQFQHLNSAGLFLSKDPGDFKSVGGERCGHLSRLRCLLPYPTASGGRMRALTDQFCLSVQSIKKGRELTPPLLSSDQVLFHQTIIDNVCNLTAVIARFGILNLRPQRILLLSFIQTKLVTVSGRNQFQQLTLFKIITCHLINRNEVTIITNCIRTSQGSYNHLRFSLSKVSGKFSLQKFVERNKFFRFVRNNRSRLCRC